jgi:hypothetical protein
MASAFHFFVIRDSLSCSTPQAASHARRRVLAALDHHEVVRIDCREAEMTPLFAEEFFGELAAELGQATFRERVELQGVDPGLRPMLSQVVARRWKGQPAA